jgi:bifunctional DNase/RNase
MGTMELLPAQVRRVYALQTTPHSGAGVLVETEEKSFFIAVGITEAHAIIRELRDNPAKRPMTHDLMVHAMRGFDIEVKRVVISSLVDGTFCATLLLARTGSGDGELREELMLDARASDSIVLALKYDVSLEVSRQVLDEVEDVTATLHSDSGILEEDGIFFGGATEDEDEDEEDDWPPDAWEDEGEE